MLIYALPLPLPSAACCHDTGVAIPGEDASRAFGKAIHLETMNQQGKVGVFAKGETDNRIELVSIHQQHT